MSGLDRTVSLGRQRPGREGLLKFHPGMMPPLLLGCPWPSLTLCLGHITHSHGSPFVTCWPQIKSLQPHRWLPWVLDRVTGPLTGAHLSLLVSISNSDFICLRWTTCCLISRALYHPLLPWASNDHQPCRLPGPNLWLSMTPLHLNPFLLGACWILLDIQC